MATEVKYPDVHVQLSGTDGNAMAIIGKVAKALRRGGHANVADAFVTEATSGDYDNVLVTCMRWVDVS